MGCSLAIPFDESPGIDYAAFMTRSRNPTSIVASPEHWRVFLVLTSGFLAHGIGCRGGTELTIKDTEGRSFLARCGADRTCTLTANSGPSDKLEVDGRPHEVSAGRGYKFRATGRVVGICGPIAAGAEPAASDCRPVVCETDGDCPASEGLRVGVCINRNCTEPSHTINSDDAVMLCLAETGIFPRTALQIERFALGLNCGTPCRVPKPCRQP